MTREEFYTQRRIWRMVHSSISSPSMLSGSSRKTPESKAAWGILYDKLYCERPKIFSLCVPPTKRASSGTWGIKSRGSIACNIEMLPNSWPHPTKNP